MFVYYACVLVLIPDPHLQNISSMIGMHGGVGFIELIKNYFKKEIVKRPGCIL